MKALLRSFVAEILAHLARAVITKYQPMIVMVTGSVGKTSTKDAVAAALSTTYDLRASEKSYNTEFGVPFTIFGAQNPWNSVTAWIGVVHRALALVFMTRAYPQLLVLEVGADRPGDLAKILRIVTPDAVVVTHLPNVPVHVEAYASPRAVHEEEFAPAYALPDGAPLILSCDDGHALKMAEKLPVEVFSFGFTKGADVEIMNPEPYLSGNTVTGMKATVITDGTSYPLIVTGALGRPQLYAPAAALALAKGLGISVEEALKALKAYVPPPGRARLLSGVNGSTLIDDSYNASPAAVVESLSALALMKGGRKIAVLGDMLELGRYSVEEHERLGKEVAKSVDVLVAVGARSQVVASAARAAGLKEDMVHEHTKSPEAAEALLGLVQEGDLVLIKGSQGMRMERIVARLLEDQKDTDKLVRQETEWLLIK
ncbi:UDP-N-acetylmuramoyl-tripeptide--D-alanyl-D-alanine ligase [Patescibacteria group bacterium]|nr:UDP-N-acetylmuramoyl-tripeptide--D-alanyl-D-alanine ligase [Patescibacteria group bacterium]